MPSFRLSATLLSLSAVLLTSCTASSPLMDKSRGSAYCSLPTRWSTVDKSNESEVHLKEKTLKNIDKFWADFAKDKTELSLALDNLKGESGKANSELLVSWMDAHLLRIDPAIEYEFGPLRGQKGHKLDFSAYGRDRVVQIAKKLAASAPKLPDWKFGAYRQPLAASEVAAGFKSRGGIEVLPFETDVVISPDNKLDVTYVSPSFSGDSEEDAKVCKALNELILGEQNADEWLGKTTARKSALAAQFSCAASSEALTKVFETRKKEILASLPAKYYAEISSDAKTVELIPEADDKGNRKRNNMNTKFEKLGKTLISGQRFHSEQFSKLGEKFAYLQIPDSKDLADQPKRKLLESALDAELKKAKVGCVFAEGFGDTKTAYLDLCLSDYKKAEPILKRFCSEQKLPHGTSLRFYDSDWLSEWIGMFDDSPVPKDLAHPWFDYLHAGT